jgi:ribosome recycling factor
VNQYGDDWINHAPQETMNYLAQNLEKLGLPAADRRSTIPVTIPRLTSLKDRAGEPLYIVRGVSEEQRQAIEAALPGGRRLVPRRDGSFTIPQGYRKPVQAAVNRIANPLISQVANMWEQSIRAADAQRR